MLEALGNLSPVIFMVGILCFLVSVAVISLRLKLLLSTQDINMGGFYLIKLSLMSYFFSSFLPTSAGGDFVKAFYIAKSSGRTLESYTTVFIDRFIGMFTIFLLGSAALLGLGGFAKYSFRWLLPALLGISIIFFLFIVNKKAAKGLSRFFIHMAPERLNRILSKTYNAMHMIKNHKEKIVIALFLSILGQVVCFAAIYFFARDLGSSISLKLALLVMSIATVLSMMPSIYGVGPREMSIVFILGPIIGEDKGLLIAFLWLCLLLTMSLLGGITYALFGKYKIDVAELPDTVG